MGSGRASLPLVPMTATLRLLQLWQHRTKTCRLTPASEPPPYWVVVHDNGEPLSQRTFDTHDEATVHAIEELRRATAPAGTR